MGSVQFLFIIDSGKIFSHREIIICPYVPLATVHWEVVFKRRLSGKRFAHFYKNRREATPLKTNS